MARYFLDVMYKGTAYSGFQIQDNAITVQSEVEKAMRIYLKENVSLTGSSRTDAGVHAMQNYFHFDTDMVLPSTFLYNLNAILPSDIVLKKVQLIHSDAHCRFDAISRKYTYRIYRHKNPFYADRAWYYPFPLDVELLNLASRVIKDYTDFTSFSKRNTQVKTFQCSVTESSWECTGDMLLYHVRSNRFLRGMVRGLVGTMLHMGKGKIGEQELRNIIESRDCSNADFTTPAHGLFLMEVQYPEGYFENKD